MEDLKGNGEARVNLSIGRGCTISEHKVVEAATYLHVTDAFDVEGVQSLIGSPLLVVCIILYVQTDHVIYSRGSMLGEIQQLPRCRHLGPRNEQFQAGMSMPKTSSRSVTSNSVLSWSERASSIVSEPR